MNYGRQLKRIAELYGAKRDRKRRQLPQIAMHSFAGAPTIYYLAPDENRPSGGLRVIYRHVDLLNTLGVPAAVVHHRVGFRCSWFDNATRVISLSSLRLRESDLLVVPEFYAAGFASLPRGARLVVFNQGPHHTFDLIPLRENAPGWPYSEAGRVEGILTVSRDGAKLLEFAFPGCRIGMARNVVDSSVL